MKNEKTNIAFVTFSDEECVGSATMYNENPFWGFDILVAPAGLSYLEHLKDKQSNLNSTQNT